MFAVLPSFTKCSQHCLWTHWTVRVRQPDLQGLHCDIHPSAAPVACLRNSCNRELTMPTHLQDMKLHHQNTCSGLPEFAWVDQGCRAFTCTMPQVLLDPVSCDHYRWTLDKCSRREALPITIYNSIHRLVTCRFNFMIHNNQCATPRHSCLPFPDGVVLFFSICIYNVSQSIIT